MLSHEESLKKKYFTILMVVASYWLISIAMVFLNKSLLSGQTSLDAPLFITWFQCVVTAALSCFVSFSKRPFPNLAASIPTIEPSAKTLTKVMPLSVFVAMITFNNLCLKHVGVSFYFVGRSLTTVFSVALTYIILGKRTSVRAIFCCVAIIVGFWLGVDQEGETGSLTLSGAIYGVLASLFVALDSIYKKRVLPELNDSVWLLTAYNNINAIILFLPLMIAFGEPSLVGNYPGLLSLEFWIPMTLAGVMGLLIGYVSTLQIKVTSPLTNNISGTAKAAAQTVIATQWNAEVKSSLWWLSNFVVLIGSAAYARVRQLEMEMAAESNPPPPPSSSILTVENGDLSRRTELTKTEL